MTRPFQPVFTIPNEMIAGADSGEFHDGPRLK